MEKAGGDLWYKLDATMAGRAAERGVKWSHEMQAAFVFDPALALAVAEVQRLGAAHCSR